MKAIESHWKQYSYCLIKPSTGGVYKSYNENSNYDIADLYCRIKQRANENKPIQKAV